jgi:uncharacterized UPF0160 family protein
VSKLIATHSGSFHADDVFGVAVLAALFPDHRIVRSRDPADIAPADFVVDVGGIWDPAGGRFDHHQRGFSGARLRSTPEGGQEPAEGYASAGLVWREFGSAYVRQVAESMGTKLDDETTQGIAREVDLSLVRYLDLVDTGAADVAPGVFGLSSQLSLLNSTWLEEQALDRAGKAQLQVDRFHEAMAIARRFLDRFILRSIGQLLAADKVRSAERLLQGRVLHLADGGLPWTRVVVEEMPEVMLAVYPEWDTEQYILRTVPARLGSFASRMDLPQDWSGLRGAELAAVCGVPDAVFCHTNLFIGAARSLEGALRMAGLALAARPAAAP